MYNPNMSYETTSDKTDQPTTSEKKCDINEFVFDESFSPNTDFFHYVNNRWIQENPIPDDYTRWGGFEILHEENLKRKKQRIDKISGIAIPEIMQTMKLKTMKLSDGSGIEIKEIYSATIPVANKEGAFTWLRENGLGDLIKNEVTVAFGRNEDNKASEYADLARGRGYQPTQKLKVEPMTLKALFRERSENNQELPSEHFNLFKGNKTKITRSK